MQQALEDRHLVPPSSRGCQLLWLAFTQESQAGPCKGLLVTCTQVSTEIWKRCCYAKHSSMDIELERAIKDLVGSLEHHVLFLMGVSGPSTPQQPLLVACPARKPSSHHHDCLHAQPVVKLIDCFVVNGQCWPHMFVRSTSPCLQALPATWHWPIV